MTDLYDDKDFVIFQYQSENYQTDADKYGWQLYQLFHFLDKSSHLYNRVCPSVRRSVGRSVGPSFRHAFVKNKGNQYFRANKSKLIM